MSTGAISSRSSAPNIFGTAQSPDNLPQGGVVGSGYSMDQLIAYIRRQLGEPVWAVELTNQQIADNINDALQMFSLYVPLQRVGNLILNRGQFKYLEDVDVGQGVTNVSFVEPNPVPTEIFYLWQPNQSRTAVPCRHRRVRLVPQVEEGVAESYQR